MEADMPESKKDDALAPISADEKEKVVIVSEDTSQKQSKPRGELLRCVLGFFLRLVLFLAFLAALAAGAYFGLPILYERYVRPVEMNSSQLNDLTRRGARHEEQIADLESQLTTLEAVSTSQAASITELSARIDNLDENVTARIDALDEKVAAHTKTLSVLEEMQVSLQESDEATQAELERKVDMLKAMELLSRARLFLYQSNFGLAAQDVQVARDLLAEIQPDAPEPQDEEIAETIRRLDLVLENLPTFPVVASDDLDIAWHILLTGIPPQELETPTPETAPESESTPATEPETTPTPTPSE
jgi:hypothetical protein